MLYDNNSNTDLLGLANVFISKKEETTSKITINISMPVSSHACPNCGTLTKRVHDYHEQHIKDLPIRGMSTFLILRKRRYVCPECGKRFYPKLDFLPRYHHMTSRIYPSIINELRESVSVKSVAKRYNVSQNTGAKELRNTRGWKLCVNS